MIKNSPSYITDLIADSLNMFAFLLSVNYISNKIAISVLYKILYIEIK